MVAQVDELQAKGYVERRAQPDNRRKNIITLTTKGRNVMQRGARLIDPCERSFLGSLSEADSERLKDALTMIIDAEDA